jgi:pimeloyl-ACP methyl ester carboxylesterase
VTGRAVPLGGCGAGVAAADLAPGLMREPGIFDVAVDQGVERDLNEQFEIELAQQQKRVARPFGAFIPVAQDGDKWAQVAGLAKRHRAGSGDPLLLLHGLGLTWRCWRPVLPDLERAHDVVAMDLPGFGAAPPLPRGRRPTVAALSDAIEAALDDAGLESVHVAGNSLGGWIAIELARRGRARSVVALSPAGLELPPERLYVISLNQTMRLRAMAAAPVAPVAVVSRVARTALLAPMRSRPWRVSAGEAAEEVRAFGRSPGFQPTLHWTIAVGAPAGLDAVAVPVRICFGTRDVMLAPLTAPRYAAAIPGADLRPLHGCGHVPMADDPARVAAAITDVTTTR